MGIMNVIRNRMHVVLWLLLILFLGSMTVGGLVGGADIINQLLGRTDVRKAIGVVNGDIIDPNQFFQIVNQRLEEYRQQGQEIDDRQLDQIRQTTWDDMVETLLIQQEINRQGITVTDDEIYFHLENNPPPELQQYSFFQTNDQFDMEKYLQALHNPQGDEWKVIEDYMRNFLPRLKLQTAIQASAFISAQEVKEEYLRQTTNFTVLGVTVKNSQFTEAVEPSEDEVKEYYQEHKDEFFQEERRKMRYVKWDKLPSKEDTSLAYQDALDLFNRIKKGEDFATLANQYSQDPGNKSGSEEGKGGNLGWFDRNRMVKSFSDAAFGAKVGETVGPVLSNFGYHLIYVRDKREKDGKEEVLASHILIKIDMGPSTREKIRNKAIDFSFDVEDYGFQEAIQRNNLTSSELPPLPENAHTLPLFGYFRDPVKFAFSHEVGANSEILESERSFALFYLDSILVAGTRPFEEVKDQIFRKLKFENQKFLANKVAEQIYENVLNGSTFQLEADSIKEATLFGPVTFSLSKPTPQIGRSPEVMGALMTAQVGDLIPPIEIGGGYAVLVLEDKSDFDPEDYHIKKDVLYNRLFVSRQNNIVNEWLEELKNKADIVDNRKYYF